MRVRFGEWGRKQPPDLEMTADGVFVERRPPPPWLVRVIAVAILVAVIAGAIALAALALWFALILIPVAIVAVLIAWAGFRFQLWRARRRSVGGQPDLFRG
jgi:fatty acid desaturase